MDKLFRAKDQKKVAILQEFDKGMRLYCSQKDVGAVFKSFEWVTVLLEFSC